MFQKKKERDGLVFPSAEPPEPICKPSPQSMEIASVTENKILTQANRPAAFPPFPSLNTLVPQTINFSKRITPRDCAVAVVVDVVAAVCSFIAAGLANSVPSVCVKREQKSGLAGEERPQPHLISNIIVLLLHTATTAP